MSDDFHGHPELLLQATVHTVSTELQVTAGCENQDDLATHLSDRLHGNVIRELASYGLQLEIGRAGGRYGSLLNTETDSNGAAAWRIPTT